jgi:hypothetical protein
MTTDNSGSVIITAVMQEQNTSFLQDEVQLKKLAREITKATKPAIEVLLRLMEKSTDEKIQMQCAIKLLEFDIDIKKAISQDQMQRLIAEIKLNRGVATTKMLQADEDNGKPKPIVDFSTIRTF